MQPSPPPPKDESGFRGLRPILFFGLIFGATAGALWFQFDQGPSSNPESTAPVQSQVLSPEVSEVSQDPGQISKHTAHRPIAISTDGYLGSDSCRECHRHEHATWHDSFHRTMTQVASAEAVVGDFRGVRLDRGSQSFTLGTDGGKFWVDVASVGPVGVASAASSTRKQIELCTGSHHMQVYWISTGRGRELFDLPFVWLIDERRWIPRESSFLLTPTHPDNSPPSHWNGSCINCHTTHGNRNLNPPEPAQSTVAEFGISCEACHGPGEEHVRKHRSSAGSTGTDDSIVHPGRLAHQRSTEVCGQCHMAWHHQVKGSDLSFRPGDKLIDLRQSMVNPTQFWRDGMIRVVGREFNGLLNSPCFQKGEMSCLSCHVLHQKKDDLRSREEWRDDQLKPEMRTNQACLSCHENYRSEETLAQHTHHAPASPGSLCYNCHMPNSTYGLLKATRSHQISNPSVTESLNAGRPNACNLCHLDRSLEWTDDKLAEWYGYSRNVFSKSDPEVALSVSLALSGDASQRALIAWHLGWEPARKASQDDWMAPYLSVLMADDYPAVRYIAHRSLRQIGGYDDIEFDAELPAEQRQRVMNSITLRWRRDKKISNRPMVLISPAGELNADVATEMLKRRDQSKIYLEE